MADDPPEATPEIGERSGRGQLSDFETRQLAELASACVALSRKSHKGLRTSSTNTPITAQPTNNYFNEAPCRNRVILLVRGIGQMAAFFDTCFGVFQGGGCRAAALAGAFDAATTEGVHFAQVAGTSAGAIVAALVGAGASPEHLKRVVCGLDFRRFLVPAEPEFKEMPFAKLFLGGGAYLFSQQAQYLTALRKFLVAGGLHSPNEVETWMDAELAVLLPNSKRPITFGDLLIPTFVVATDLLKNRAEVWSSFETAEESVAFAVSASCAIPGFFQPVKKGDKRYVDGGVLSNLPAFVFAGANVDRPRAAKTLAFQLVSAYDQPKRWTPLELTRRVVGVAVDGATDLQVQLQDDVHLIAIPTGGVSATDFESMNQDEISRLMEAGASTTRTYLKGLDNRGKTRTLQPLACSNDDDLFSFVVSRGYDVREVIVLSGDAEWIWRLFPTVLIWRMNGVSVRVALKPITAAGKGAIDEANRRLLLQRLGVALKEDQDLPFEGFLLDGNDQVSAALGLKTSRKNASLPKAMCYQGAQYNDVIRPFVDKANTIDWDHATDAGNGRPQVVPFEKAELFDLLRSVRQYRHSDVEFTMERVPVDRMRMIRTQIREFKYRQAERLVTHLTNAGFELFAPLAIQFSDGSRSVFGPPVVEKYGDEFVIIEGNTKITHCRLTGRKEIRCVVVKGVSEDLPASAVDIRKGLVVAQRPKQPPWDYNKLRRVEEALGKARPRSEEQS